MAKACPAGKKRVHIKSHKAKARSFCAKVKKSKGGRKGGKGTAARKAALRKACANVSASKRETMKGLCKWARS